MPSILKPKDFLQTRYGSGSWVVITGVTGGDHGIGRAFCYEFARRNFNLVLIDEDRSQLEEQAQQIKQAYPTVMTKIIVTDFEKSAEKGWVDAIAVQLKGLSISVLVNAFFRQATFDSKTPVEESIRRTIIVNSFPTVLLTQRIMPRLAERHKAVKLRGAIITVTAETGTITSWHPGFLVHAATTSLSNICTVLGGLTFKESVDCLSVNPFAVSCHNADGLVTITPDRCARSSIEQLRYNVGETNGWWFHCIQGFLLKSLPYKVLYRSWPKVVVQQA
jgi:17beta-estradiol 17-dehydrogenase / very-long-chain 3-oxoacyl-CoA reductase